MDFVTSLKPYFPELLISLSLSHSDSDSWNKEWCPHRHQHCGTLIWPRPPSVFLLRD